MKSIKTGFIAGISALCVAGSVQAAVVIPISMQNSIRVAQLETQSEPQIEIQPAFQWVSEEMTEEITEEIVKDENIHTALILVQDAKLRKQPDPDAEIIRYIDKDTEVIVEERINDWYKIVLSDEEGYIYKSQIDDKHLNKLPYKRTDIPSGAQATYIIDEKAKLREKPDPDADIIEYLEKDTTVFALERVNDWYKVTLGQQEGYIYKSQVETSNLGNIPSRNDVDETYIGYEVVEYAKQFLGNPYVYGGNSLTHGVDCSGFTTQIMKKFGVSLSRSSRAQYANNGYHVSEKDILPGDLVFYAADGKNIDHVAIYAGNNQIIHANSSKTGICMSKLHYGKPLVGIKRVLK